MIHWFTIVLIILILHIFQAKDFNKNYKTIIHLYRCKFDECHKCKAYNRNPEHECYAQEDAKRIDSIWTVAKVFAPAQREYVKYTLQREEDVIGYTVFSNCMDPEFALGEHVHLQGWQRQETRHNVLLATRVNE